MRRYQKIERAKRVFAFLCALLMIGVIVMPFTAIAEAADVPEMPMTAEPYTWQFLVTIAGATAATLLIVQFCKVPLDKVWKIPTRVFVYIVALAILLIATAFTSGLTIENAPLAAVNAFLVALTAYGSYEVTFAKMGK